MQKWLMQATHISWRLAAMAFGIIAGTAASLALPLLLADGVFVIAAGTGCLLAIRWRGRWVVLLAFCAGAMLGAWRGTGQLAALHVYEPYRGQTVTLRGALHDDASVGSRGDQRFVLKHVSIHDRQLPGEVWISSAVPADIKRGDIVTAQGNMGEGFGTFPTTMYRARIAAVERPQPGDIARRIRDAFARAVRQGVPEPGASLGIGYLTGQRSTLPATLDEQLRVVGLTHAVVASGYNLTILVSFARDALQRFSKYLATIVAGGMVLAFMMVTGLSPSMSRAGLVAGLGLVVWYYGRSMHPFVLLPVAAALTLVFRPAYAWGDIGWCLSFAAFAGVIVLAPLLRHYFWEAGRDPPMVVQLVLDTIAAQLATLPIILFCFGQYATYALAANLLVLPLVPLAMACTFMAGVGGLLLPGIAVVVGYPAHLLLTYMIWIIERVAALPGAQEEVSFGITRLIASYILLSLLSFYLWRKTGLDFRAGTENAKNS